MEFHWKSKGELPRYNGNNLEFSTIFEVLQLSSTQVSSLGKYFASDVLLNRFSAYSFLFLNHVRFAYDAERERGCDCRCAHAKKPGSISWCIVSQNIPAFKSPSTRKPPIGDSHTLQITAPYWIYVARSSWTQSHTVDIHLRMNRHYRPVSIATTGPPLEKTCANI